MIIIPDFSTFFPQSQIQQTIEGVFVVWGMQANHRRNTDKIRSWCKRIVLAPTAKVRLGMSMRVRMLSSLDLER